MLFFRELIQERLSDTKFRAVYDEECHICGTTVKLVSALEEDDRLFSSLSRELNVPARSLADLKAGDHCDPFLVRNLCLFMGLDPKILMQHCKKIQGL